MVLFLLPKAGSEVRSILRLSKTGQAEDASRGEFTGALKLSYELHNLNSSRLSLRTALLSIQVMVERNQVTGRFGFKLSEIYDKDAGAARLFVTVLEDVGSRVALSESSTSGVKKSFLESGDEVIGFSETEPSGVADERSSHGVEINSDKLLMDEAVRRLSLVGAGQCVKLKVG